MRKRTDWIVLHTSATPPRMDIGAADIDKWHKARGWSGIGYHLVLRRNGTLERGRDLDAIGAHAIGINAQSVAVCMVGGVDDNLNPQNNYTDEQWQMITPVVTALLMRYPEADIIGHNDIPGVTKACPSFDVRKWWAEEREEYLGRLLDSLNE